MFRTPYNSANPIFIAVKNGDLAFVIENAQRINELDDELCTLLHHAAHYGHLSIVQWLLKNGATARANTKGATALHFAAQAGHLEIMHCLLTNNGFYLQDIGGREATLLHYAAYFGQIEVVQWLLSQPDIDVNAGDKYDETALHYAVKNGHLKTIECLVLTGNIDVEAENSEQETAIHFAVGFHHLDILQWLVRYGRSDIYKLNQVGQNPLHIALEKDNFETVKWLVEACKIPIGDKTNEGETAIDVAKTLNRSELIIQFLEQYSQPSLQLNDKPQLTYSQSTLRRQNIIDWSFTLNVLVNLNLPNNIASLIVSFVDDTCWFAETNPLETILNYLNAKADLNSFAPTNPNMNYQDSVLEQGKMPTKGHFNILNNRRLIQSLETQVQSQQRLIKQLEDKVEQLTNRVLGGDEAAPKTDKKQKTLQCFFMPEPMSRKRPRDQEDQLEFKL